MGYGDDMDSDPSRLCMPVSHLISGFIILLYFVSSMTEAVGSAIRPLQLWATSSMFLSLSYPDALLFPTLDAPSLDVPVYCLDSQSNILCTIDRVLGKCVHISGAESQREAVSLVGSVDWLLLNCTEAWTMIPVENLLSFCASTSTKLGVFVRRAEDVPGLAFALQVGVDALILHSDLDSTEKKELWVACIQAREQRREMSTIAPLKKKIRQEEKEEESITSEGIITQITSAGLGDRVCLDFIQLLHEGEGVWIGSCARSLLLIHAEVSENAFVPSRPFRVNCGAVHSYVLMADGGLKYLSEVKAGDRVRVTSARLRGKSRDGIVGRVKLEPRPMMKISFSYDGGEGQVFLQQAETVKVLVSVSGSDGGKDGKEWEAVAVTELKEGRKGVFVRLQCKGTHVGKAIDAQVIER